VASRSVPDPVVIPWRLVALIAGATLAAALAGCVLILMLDRHQRTTYDEGIADPADFGREEAMVRVIVTRGNPRVGFDQGERKVAFVKFGPNYRFTKYERRVKRMDPAFAARMNVFRRGRASDPTDPPATAVRVVFADAPTPEGTRTEDRVYYLDGNLDLVMSEANVRGDAWVATMIPNWR